MYFYRFKAAKNYKNIFKLIHTTEIDRFNSCLYFYCVDNGINPLTISVNLSRVLPITEKGQSHTELLKEL
jgi:hypothetical protein